MKLARWNRHHLINRLFYKSPVLFFGAFEFFAPPFILINVVSALHVAADRVQRK